MPALGEAHVMEKGLFQAITSPDELGTHVAFRPVWAYAHIFLYTLFIGMCVLARMYILTNSCVDIIPVHLCVYMLAHLCWDMHIN